jgi:ankyrin repeat protein
MRPGPSSSLVAPYLHPLALFDAANDGEIRRLQTLLGGPGNSINSVDKNGRTALMCASYSRRVLAVLFLRERGADLEKTSRNGWTAVHWASYSIPDDPHCVRVLIEELGANPNKQSYDGRTALHCAAGYGNVNIVRYLAFNPQVSLHIKRADGKTALECAEDAGKVEVVAILQAAAEVRVFLMSAATCCNGAECSVFPYTTGSVHRPIAQTIMILD